MSSRCATRTSRRGASGGAVNRSLTRALLLLPPVFLQKNPAKQHRPDGHGAVRHVECPEAHVADADIDEVHHAERRAIAINEVSGGTAPGKAERQHLEALVRIRAAIQTPQN